MATEVNKRNYGERVFAVVVVPIRRLIVYKDTGEIIADITAQHIEEDEEFIGYVCEKASKYGVHKVVVVNHNAECETDALNTFITKNC